jgi:sRNA-binding carbon storage regulator CsrA
MASDTPKTVPEHRHIDFHPNQLKLIREEIQKALKEEARKALLRERTR